MTNLILYGVRRIPFVEKVARALEYKRLDYALVEPDGQSDYRRFNPETGLLPAMRIGEEFVHDSTAILNRIDEVFPERPLLASDPRIAASQRQLEDWSDECFLWYFAVWSAMAKNAGDAKPKRTLRGWAHWLLQQLDPPDPGTPRPRPFKMSHETLLSEIAGRLDDLEKLLGDRPFFYATEPSMADFAIYAMVKNMADGIGIPGTQSLAQARPALMQHAERVEAASAPDQTTASTTKR